MPTDNHVPISSLFTPTVCGTLPLKNRIVYPAMTRARFVDGVANDEVIKCMPLHPHKHAVHHERTPPSAIQLACAHVMNVPSASQITSHVPLLV